MADAMVAVAIGIWAAATALAYAAGDWLPRLSRMRASVAGSVPVLVLFGGALLLLALGLRMPGATRKRVTALALALAAALLGAGRGVAAWHTPGPGTVDGYLGQRVSVVAAVVAAPVTLGMPATLSAVTLRAVELHAGGRSRPVSGLVLAHVRGASPLMGEQVIATGSLRAPPRLSPTGAVDYAERLQRQGVWAEMQSPTIMALNSPPLLAPAALVGRLQQRLKASVEAAMPEPEAALLLGEVAGIRAYMPAGDSQALVNSGLAHVLAISGIKVALVVGMLTAVATAIGGRRSALAALAGVALYTAVGGASASALRSALMGSLTLVGRVIRRDTNVLRSLLLACAVMLAWRPQLAADLSFQYSFVGVLGIHLYTHPIAARLTRLPQPWREALAVTTAAQVATLPITAYYFHVVPLLAPIANALVLPTLPLMIVCGLVVAVFQTLSVPLAAIAYVTTHLTLWLAHALSSIPHAAPALPWLGPGHIAAYYITLTAVTLGTARHVRLPLTVAAAAGLSIVTLILFSMPDGKMHLRFLGGVTGPAVVVIAPDGATMLIDGGSSASHLTPVLDEALPPGRPLPGLGRRLDAVVLTGTSLEESGAFPLNGRYVAPRIEMNPGDIFDWHHVTLAAYPGSRPGQIALELRYGAAAVLIADSTDARHAVPLPRAAYDLIALGSGAAPPVDGGVSTRALVLQRAQAGGRPVAHELTQRFGSRLWRTDKDGELSVTCDNSTCNW